MLVVSLVYEVMYTYEHCTRNNWLMLLGGAFFQTETCC